MANSNNKQNLYSRAVEDFMLPPVVSIIRTYQNMAKPDIINSDQGTQYTSALWTQYLESEMGIVEFYVSF